jgi:hypothetical protein
VDRAVFRFPSLDIRVVCFTRVANDNHAVALAPWGHGSTSEFAVQAVPAYNDWSCTDRKAAVLA